MSTPPLWFYERVWEKNVIIGPNQKSVLGFKLNLSRIVVRKKVHRWVVPYCHQNTVVWDDFTVLQEKQFVLET